MPTLDKLWFSQAALSAWQNCPLKFKYRYIDGLYWPIITGGKLSEHIELGRRFHLLAQRYFACGDQEPPFEPLLASWLVRLTEYLPLAPERKYLPEYELRSAVASFRYLAKYDLLVTEPGRVTIYDWKTDEKAPRPGQASTAQTRLYLYLSAKTGFFVTSPESVRMVYWNPRFPDNPLVIDYSQQQYQADGAWLEELLKQIKSAKTFPATTAEKNCRFCEYSPICHGGGLEEVLEEMLSGEEVNWDQVEEIVLQGVNFQ